MIGSEKFIGSGLSNWGDIAPPLHFTICGKLHCFIISSVVYSCLLHCALFGSARMLSCFARA
jgi:hypothetical protein